MHGVPALSADFSYLPYFNPDAPRRGRLVWGILGTFDSLNPMIVKGIPVQQVRSYGYERGYVIESLMARGENEPFTLYGLLAKTVETDDARDFVTFRLDPSAHFSDGKVSHLVDFPVVQREDLDGIKLYLGEVGWVMVRASGTENVLRIYSETGKPETTSRVLTSVSSLVESL